MKRMQEKDVPAFVQEVAATGCHICAVGHGHYVTRARSLEDISHLGT